MTPDDDGRREQAKTPRPRGRQAEAAVNDGLILQAAREVLTVEPDAPMAEIAARAGVGIGSLYRRFPSKEALAYRLCLDGMSALADLARRTIEVIDDDPWDHFVAFIGDAIDAGAGSLRGLAGTFEADEDLNRVAERMSALIQEVLQRAQAAGAVRDDINANDIGRFFEMLRGIQKLREAAAAGGRPEPGLEELASQLKTSRENVEAALSLYQICSLHQPINGSQEETIEEALIGDEGITIDESETLRQALGQLLDSLAPNEKQVLRLRYGLAKGFTKTVEEVAASLKLTRERVRQIEAKAIAKLRADPAIQGEKVRFLAS